MSLLSDFDSARFVTGGRVAVLLCIAATSAGCDVAVGDDNPAVVDIEDERTYGVSWEDYRSQATVTGDGWYVAEWDLLFASEAQLREHYERQVLRETPKLAVYRRSDGFEPTFLQSEQLEITYCISNTFSNKSEVVGWMATATKSWEDVASLRFVYLSSQDASCNHNNTNVQFAVAPTTTSFSAGCATNKKLWKFGCLVDSPPAVLGVLTLHYASPLGPGETWVGVLRHELGHILGFEHEHHWAPNPAPGGGCNSQSARDESRQLTPYDVESAMHYQTCNGIPGRDFIVSARDGEGARAVYGIPAAWHIPLFYTVLAQ